MVEASLKENLLKYDVPVPRYTSYPAAPHFKPAEGFPATYESWLGALDAKARLSLYIHVPFCPKMCHYCGCHTKITRRYAPVEDYAHILMREITILAAHLKPQQEITHLHFGGGSPTMLRSHDFMLLMENLRTRIPLAKDADIAIEIDPRQLTEGRIATYAKAGVNRASLGVQDFDQKVLNAVNRAQPFHLTYDAIKMLRDYGVNDINIDLMYGLPHQTEDSMKRAADYTMLLGPDRIALFGYAHVPWMKKHMRLIDESTLPTPNARFDLFEVAAAELESAGYIPVGIDHFARPGDSMASALEDRALHRNFQGYTTDASDALLGLGASAIGKMPQGYVQNSPDMPVYQDHILNNRLPVTKICQLSDDDRLRATVIEQLMCYMSVDLPALCAAHKVKKNYFAESLNALEKYAQDGLVIIDKAAGKITVPPQARHAVRLICSCFDAYYRPATEQRHARAV